MKKSVSLPLTSVSRRRLLTGSTATAALALFGCGGGSTHVSACVSTGGTDSFACGPIRGLGSIIVGGVHYDERSASVTTETGAGKASDLRLGMVVEVTGGDVSTNSTGVSSAAAKVITVRSEIEGPISAIDTTARTIIVLGQAVLVPATTVFDDDLIGGLANLKVGQVIEVYGLLSASGQYTATRIDDKDRATRYKLRGPVSRLNTSAKTFQIGSTVISYSNIAAPAGLANGAYARALLSTKASSANIWTATALTVSRSSVATATEGSVKAEIEGYITHFTSSTSFVVAGVTVNASGINRLPQGLALGKRVEVEGMLANGVLTATEVELDDDDSGSDGIEIEGAITAINTNARTFVVRGVTVRYTDATLFEHGTAAMLAVGVKVEVTGTLSGDGVTLMASEIEFDD